MHAFDWLSLEIVALAKKKSDLEKLYEERFSRSGTDIVPIKFHLSYLQITL